MAARGKLSDHPRLYAGKVELNRVKQKPRRALLRAAAEYVAEKAEEYITPVTFEHLMGMHNHTLRCARKAQIRVVTLLVRWVQTGRRRHQQQSSPDSSQSQGSEKPT